jgi:nitrogen fixation NifU-like protein
MTELTELYQELIVDHFKNPRCKGRLDCPHAECSLLNPLCGDEVSIQIELAKDRINQQETISQVRFDGKGCSISQASASMMSELCEGKTVEDARKLAEHFTLMLKDKIAEDELVKLGDAASLQGVRRFAARIKCAMLGWEALSKCLDSAISNNRSDKVSLACGCSCN